MIEINMAEIAKYLVQHLEILAAVRCLCTKNELPVDWILDWENGIAGELRALRLAIAEQGEVLILDD